MYKGVVYLLILLGRNFKVLCCDWAVLFISVSSYIVFFVKSLTTADTCFFRWYFEGIVRYSFIIFNFLLVGSKDLLV